MERRTKDQNDDGEHDKAEHGLEVSFSEHESEQVTQGKTEGDTHGCEQEQMPPHGGR